MLKIKDNLYFKKEIKSISNYINFLEDKHYVKIRFIDGSEDYILDATIDDVIDLDKKGD